MSSNMVTHQTEAFSLHNWQLFLSNQHYSIKNSGPYIYLVEFTLEFNQYPLIIGDSCFITLLSYMLYCEQLEAKDYSAENINLSDKTTFCLFSPSNVGWAVSV